MTLSHQPEKKSELTDRNQLLVQGETKVMLVRPRMFTYTRAKRPHYTVSQKENADMHTKHTVHTDFE